jgi:ATP-dependent helicase/nuclease subunit B
MDDTRPTDIVVVFRSVTEVARRIEEVFARYGIPFWLESKPRIARAAAYKTLVALLQLDQEDWPFRRVVSVLTNNSLSKIESEGRRAAEWLVRDLQLAQGRAQLLETIGQLVEQQGEAIDLSEHRRRRIAAAVAAQPAIIALAAALDRLPREATPNEWCAALAQFGADLGLSPFQADSPRLRRGFLGAKDPAIGSNPGEAGGCESAPLGDLHVDVPAWAAIVNHFAAVEQLDGWLGAAPRKLDRRALVSLLIDVATHESLPRGHDDVGRVRVLSAQSARAVTARHLYLAGMSEQSFPAAVRQNQLATEAEYRFFTNAAHQRSSSDLSDKALPTQAQEEMLLFYEVLSRALQSLTISYPAMDDKAQELPPSPYVVELQRMFNGSEKQIRCAKAQLSPVPHVGSIYSVPDWRIAAMAQALSRKGDRRLIAGLITHPATKPLGQAIDAGVRIVRARARGEKFGPHEGLLTSPAVAARLAERFGRRHCWSPSQWETYAACPFKFYLQAVLNLEPLGDLVLETDFARRGSRLHQVLAAFHREWAAAGGERPATAEEEREQFFKHFCKVIDHQIAASPPAGLDGALLELDRRQILKWARRHFDHHAKYDRGCGQRGPTMTPTHFEFRFGSSQPGETDADPNSTSDVFTLDIGGEPIRVAGQIDRIDVGTLSGKTVFNVIDYKSARRASLKAEQLATGQQLQLPIYVEAAQVLLFDGKATSLAAGYWSMGAGFDEKGVLVAASSETREKTWRDTRKLVHELVRKFVDDIRQGNFPVDSRDEKCTGYCEYSLVCRVGQVRSVGKLWWPEIPGDA